MSLYDGILFAAPPPEGVLPNINAPYEADNLLGVIGVFFPITTAIMGVRIYTRVSLSGNFAFDDYLMIIAFILGIIMIAFILNMLNYGLGKHLWDVPVTHLMPNWSFDNVMAAIMFCAATGFAKGSILLFYLRIFPTRTMRWAVWLSFAFVFGFSAASVFVNIFSCNPIRGSWDLEASMTAVCINRPVFYFAQAGLGIFADILTVVLPLPMLRTLQLPMKQKVGIGAVLTMGAFVCVVSIIRLQSLQLLLTDVDLTKNTTTALAWCVVELLLSIIGGSIPALKPFFRRFFPSLLATTQRFGNGSSKYQGGTPFSRRYASGFAARSTRRSTMRPNAPEFIMTTRSVQVTSYSAANGDNCPSPSTAGPYTPTTPASVMKSPSSRFFGKEFQDLDEEEDDEKFIFVRPPRTPATYGHERLQSMSGYTNVVIQGGMREPSPPPALEIGENGELSVGSTGEKKEVKSMIP